jgi:hypothetical protein
MISRHPSSASSSRLAAGSALPGSCELADQVLALGYVDLAAALDRLIHVRPCRDELRTGLEVGEKLVNV